MIFRHGRLGWRRRPWHRIILKANLGCVSPARRRPIIYIFIFNIWIFWSSVRRHFIYSSPGDLFWFCLVVGGCTFLSLFSLCTQTFSLCYLWVFSIFPISMNLLFFSRWLVGGRDFIIAVNDCKFSEVICVVKFYSLLFMLECEVLRISSMDDIWYSA